MSTAITTLSTSAQGLPNSEPITSWRESSEGPPKRKRLKMKRKRTSALALAGKEISLINHLMEVSDEKARQQADVVSVCRANRIQLTTDAMAKRFEAMQQRRAFLSERRLERMQMKNEFKDSYIRDQLSTEERRNDLANKRRAHTQRLRDIQDRLLHEKQILAAKTNVESKIALSKVIALRESEYQRKRNLRLEKPVSSERIPSVDKTSGKGMSLEQRIKATYGFGN